MDWKQYKQLKIFAQTNLTKIAIQVDVQFMTGVIGIKMSIHAIGYD